MTKPKQAKMLKEPRSLAVPASPAFRKLLKQYRLGQIAVREWYINDLDYQPPEALDYEYARRMEAMRVKFLADVAALNAAEGETNGEHS